MKKQQFYIVFTLLVIAVLLICFGASCKEQSPPKETASPPSTTAPTVSQTTAPATQPATTPGEDNVVTFPADEWGDWEEPSATAGTTPEQTVQGSGTQAPTKAPTTTATVTTPTNTAAPTAGATATPERDNLATLTPDETENTTATKAPTGTPKPSATPIGTDSEGYVDKWY